MSRRAALSLVLLAGALASTATPDRLAQEINAVLSDGRLAGARVGVHVCALGTGRVLFSRNAMADFIPASNQKILTAAAAFRELGEDYHFETTLWAAGEMVAGEGLLEGDLVLQGGGDPTLGSHAWGVAAGSPGGEQPASQFERWADELKERGILRVTGDLVLDDTFFDRQFVHPDWPERQHWRQYCAPAGALSYQDNCVIVTVRAGAAVGDDAVVSLTPVVPCLRVVNRCKTSERRHAIWFQRAAGSAQIVVGGYVRSGSSGYSGMVAVPDPGLFTGEALAQVLRDHGVKLEGAVRRAQAEDVARRQSWRPLARRRTALRDVLGVMLKRSQNLYAEQVLKTVGAEAGGEGSWRTGLRRVAHMLEQLHFRADPFGVADGSGMSRNNRLSPALICAVLMEMDRSGHGETFWNLLAAAGEEGTLRRRLREPDYRGRVHAKTGYLYGVGALSGYAQTRSGIRVAFCLLINDFQQPGDNSAMKQIEDAVARAVVDWAE